MKRIIVLMLACLMLLSVVPFAVFAEEDVHEAELAECPGVGGYHTDAHIYLATEITTVEPQCGERGFTLYQCGECEVRFLANYVEANPDDTHTWKETKAAKAPTCTATGATATVKCTVCGVTAGNETIAKAPHSFVLNAATGEEVCEVCNTPKPDSACESDKATDNKHDWNFAKPVSTVDPTCDVKGSATFACKNEGCEATKTVVVAATNEHKYSKKIETTPTTCTKDGVLKAYYTCETCDNLFDGNNKTVVDAEDYDLYIEAATGHAYKCTTTDTKVMCANNCGELITVANAKPAHNTENDSKQYQDSDCVNYGFNIEICTDCGKQVKNEVIAPKGHEVDTTNRPENSADREINKPNEDGIACAPLYDRYFCTRESCVNPETGKGAPVYVKVKDAAAHSYEADVVIQAATCTLVKKTASVCSVCEYIDDATIVEHEVDENVHVSIVVVSKIGDCTAGGKVVISCEKCPYVASVTIAKNTKHTLVYTPLDDDNKETCPVDLNNDGIFDEDEGESDGTGRGGVSCKYCNDTIEAGDGATFDETTGAAIIPALSHVGGKIVETIEATCTAPKIEKWEGECELCKATEWTVRVGNPSTAKDFDSKAEANAVHSVDGVNKLVFVAGNDCAKNFEYYTCSACRVTVSVINTSKEHTYENYDCTADAECVACGKEEAKKDALADAHDIKFVSAVKPGCTTTGSLKFACANSGCTVGFTVDATNYASCKDSYAATIADTLSNNLQVLHTYFEIEKAVAAEYEKALEEAKKVEGFDKDAFDATWDAAKLQATAIAAFNKAVNAAVEAKGHTSNNPTTKPATCLTPGSTPAEVCKVCGVTMNNAQTEDAKGHAFTGTAIIETTAGCLQEGYKVYACTRDNCYTLIVTNYKPSNNHENAAEEVITPSCTDTVEDRKCVHCKKTIGTHAEKTDDTNKVSDCTTQGYTITYCEVCGETLKTVLTPGYGKHNFVDVEAWEKVTANANKDFVTEVKAGNVANMIYTPALYKDGKIEFKCSGCDEINEELTITLKAEDEIGEDYAKYIGLTLAVDNANKAGAAISDSSVVAVTVSLNSAAAINVWGVNFTFNYDVEKLTYIGFEFAEGSAFDGYTNVVNKFVTEKVELKNNLDETVKDELGNVIYVDEVVGAYIQIGANTANDVNGKLVDAIINGDDNALVTLYFEVNDKIENTIDDKGTEDERDDQVIIEVEDTTVFSLTNVTILNKKGDTVKHNEETEILTVERFLDFNKDGTVNFADVLCVWQMISGETEADYNAVVDVDKNGIVEAKDFMDLYAYVLGELDYADMVAIAA